MILDSQERMLGYIKFKKKQFEDSFELAFFIFSSKDRGKGLMTEALNQFCSYLFTTRRVNRLQLSIPDYNRAAIAVAQKSGFVFEGIARQALFSKGKYIDLCRYALLREENKEAEAF